MLFRSTLDKDDLLEGHQYSDHFMAPDRFQWQSQNRTTQDSKHGQMLKRHEQMGVVVHLFVRRSKKTQGRPTRFHYCGPLRFEQWSGERPITVTWRLLNPLPDRLQAQFRGQP